jgi:hypothetical protein
MTRTQAVNLKREAYDVYIGRAGRGQKGVFGNPVAIGRKCPECEKVHKDGGSTLGCFRKYFFRRLEEDTEFKSEVLALKGKKLGCFCKPKPCHGDVIVKYLEEDGDE